MVSMAIPSFLLAFIPYLRFAALSSAEAEFLDVIGTKSIRVFLLAIHSYFY
jgi:hypothetical protein